MSLREEMWQYEQITGESAEHVPIIKLGAFLDGYEMAIKALEQTRWIPVGEALPARDVNVLAYHRNVSFDYQYVSWIDEYSGKWAGFIGNLPDEVLAWMPLPEPYKVEGSESE